MKKWIPCILGGVYAALLSRLGSQILGRDWRIDFLVIVIGLWLLITFLLWFMEAVLRDRLRAADPRDVAALRNEDSYVDEFIREQPRSGERTDWSWIVTDRALAISLPLYPVLASMAIVHRHLSWDVAVSWNEVALLAAGATAYYLLRRVRVSRYRCPACATAPARLRSEQVRYSCANCHTIWNLGRSW